VSVACRARRRRQRGGGSSVSDAPGPIHTCRDAACRRRERGGNARCSSRRSARGLCVRRASSTRRVSGGRGRGPSERGDGGGNACRSSRRSAEGGTLCSTRHVETSPMHTQTSTRPGGASAAASAVAATRVARLGAAPLCPTPSRRLPDPHTKEQQHHPYQAYLRAARAQAGREGSQVAIARRAGGLWRHMCVCVVCEYAVCLKRALRLGCVTGK
jgi:hypothetical protein